MMLPCWLAMSWRGRLPCRCCSSNVCAACTDIPCRHAAFCLLNCGILQYSYHQQVSNHAMMASGSMGTQIRGYFCSSKSVCQHAVMPELCRLTGTGVCFLVCRLCRSVSTCREQLHPVRLQHDLRICGGQRKGAQRFKRKQVVLHLPSVGSGSPKPELICVALHI